jgi:hypothetical protein
VRSEATTVRQYLDELDPERRAEVEPVYRAVRDAMPEGYDETMAWGMITWSVPLEDFPDTYNGEPLAYVSLAAQKRHNALYLMGLYTDSAQEREFRARWTEDGRKLDMGKSCLRFRTADELRMDLVAEAVAATPPEAMMALHERAHAERPARQRKKDD